MINQPDASDNQHVFVAGRDSIYARLQQKILDPSDRHAIIFTGHDGMGKSILLQHFSTIFDDPFLSILTPLADQQFLTHDTLLQTLIDGINTILEDASFSVSRIPIFDTDESFSLMQWFKDIYLPEIISIIRPHRRIIWLLDDAEHLLTFDMSILSYWHDVLKDNHQFAMVLMISTQHEARIPELDPLINPVSAERLPRLSYDDSATLIKHYAAGANETILRSIFAATGGHPRLLTRYGQILQSQWAAHGDKEAFEKSKSLMVAASQDDFRQLWLKLTRDERLVLTAIASLIYDDPIKDVTPKRIEAWLIETDYLLDIVAINAALRGLDYQDIVRHQQGEGIALTMTLMQQWLLEQARIDDTVSVSRGSISLRRIVIAVIIIGLLIALLFLIPPQYLDPTSRIATATLAP